MRAGRWHMVLGPGQIMWSWSVRPDLWGPGWRVRVPSQAMLLARTSIHEYTLRCFLDDMEYSPPGVAEAMVTAGLVMADLDYPGHLCTWVEGWP